jgi:hypothetical protein
MTRPKGRAKFAPDAPRTWTGELTLDRLLDAAGFQVDDVQQALRAVREALNAKAKGGPDHATRLRAAEDIFGWLGFRASRRLPEADDPAGRSISITIITGEHDAPRALEAHSRAVRVVSGDGPGPENGSAHP